jgi:hypothetical protein
MTTILGSRLDVDGNTTAFIDSSTSETLLPLLPVVLDEDFVGAGHAAIPAAAAPAAGYPWVQKVVKSAGSPTCAVVANSAGGIVALTLDSASEKQDVALYANDQLNWDMTKGARWEARLALSVLPSAAAVEAVWGLQSAWIDGPDNASFYARFQVLANGAVNIQTKDGVNTITKAAGVTLVAGAYRVFHISLADPTDVRFFIDGVRVGAVGAMTFAATGASAILQPYCSVYKASGVGVGTMSVDMIQVAMNRV